MKTKILTIAAVIAMAIAAGHNVYINQNKDAVTDLMLDNVEALADGEVIVGPGYCAGNSNGCHLDGSGPFPGVYYTF